MESPQSPSPPAFVVSKSEDIEDIEDDFYDTTLVAGGEDSAQVDFLKNRTVIVLHPTPSTLYFGLNTSNLPSTIPHGLGILKTTQNLKEKTPRNPIDDDATSDGDEDTHSFDHFVKEMRKIKKYLFSKGIRGNLRQNLGGDKELIFFLEDLNNFVDDDDIQINPTTPTEDFQKKEFLFDEEILNPESQVYYSIVHPLQVIVDAAKNNSNIQLQLLSSYMALIWKFVISEKLAITPKDLSEAVIVLIIPDMFDKKLVKEMVTICFRDIGVHSIILQQESVMATFGSGLQSACVVNIGENKSSISCVEDGLSLIETRIQLGYGGKDISELLFYILKNKQLKIHRYPFPLDDYLPASYNDFSFQQKLFWNQLKEAVCHFSHEQVIPIRDIEVTISNPLLPSKSATVSFKLADAAVYTCLALFHPPIFRYLPSKIKKKVKPIENGFVKKRQRICISNDPEEDYSNRFLAQLPKTLKVDLTKQTEQKKRENRYLPLEKAIIKAITCIDRLDTRRRLFSQILLTGGGAAIPGLPELLEERIVALCPDNIGVDSKAIEVIYHTSLFDQKYVAWKGGSIITHLESLGIKSNEFTISKQEWYENGCSINSVYGHLRQKVLFFW